MAGAGRAERSRTSRSGRSSLPRLAAHGIDWRWVRGHKGHVQNEYANFLAVRAAQRLDASGGAIPSEFDAWLAAERAKGQMTGAPEPLPERGSFRPAPALPAEGAASLFL